MTTYDDFLENSHKYTAAYQAAEAAEETPRVRRLITPPFYINKLNHRIPESTQRWIRNAADERAAVE